MFGILQGASKAVVIGLQLLQVIEAMFFNGESELDVDPITVRRHGAKWSLHVSIRKENQE